MSTDLALLPPNVLIANEVTDAEKKVEFSSKKKKNSNTNRVNESIGIVMVY